jgi:hypothetical protein
MSRPLTAVTRPVAMVGARRSISCSKWVRVLAGQTVVVNNGYCLGGTPTVNGNISTWLEAEFIAD